MTTEHDTPVGKSALNQGITLEMMQQAARRRIRRAAFTLTAAVVVAACFLTWFVANFAGMGVGLVAYAVAWLAALKLVAGAAGGLSAARESARWLLPVVALLVAPHAAHAQGIGVSCPQLVTLDRTQQQLDALRADREAGIDRLPTARHQRLALEGLYRWYWPRLAEIEQQRRRAEADCRAASLRGEEPMTRVAPLPPPGPTTNDPFAPPTWQQPSGYPPPARYPAYPRYPDVNGSDPFSQPTWRQPSRYPPPASYPTYPRYPEVDRYDPFSDYPSVERRPYPRSRVRTYPPYPVWNGQR